MRNAVVPSKCADRVMVSTLPPCARRPVRETIANVANLQIGNNLPGRATNAKKGLTTIVTKTGRISLIGDETVQLDTIPATTAGGATIVITLAMRTITTNETTDVTIGGTIDTTSGENTAVMRMKSIAAQTMEFPDPKTDQATLQITRNDRAKPKVVIMGHPGQDRGAQRGPRAIKLAHPKNGKGGHKTRPMQWTKATKVMRSSITIRRITPTLSGRRSPSPGSSPP